MQTGGGHSTSGLSDAHKMNAADCLMPNARKRASVTSPHTRPSFLPLSSSCASGAHGGVSHVGVSHAGAGGSAMDMKHAGNNFV